MLRILGYIVLAILVIGLGGFIYATQGMSKYRKMVINDIDLSKLKDGVYQGAFTDGRWKNELEVTVKDHTITDIKMVKASDWSGMNAFSEKVFQLVKEKQSLQIDTVSGATVNTKAVLKSIENALTPESQS
ncbi:MAG: FMN-binding protein [Atribacterota bacterium]|nr:FMN-binding protein [Atribacterota bacterium]MDD4895658.1 FMN-binding protein [Atribacterota bacterium]MDD5637342.1 FMN-binding protein [Atribacterota bacterium]